MGGSWVVINRVISRVAILLTHIRWLVTPLITTHEPPSSTSAGTSTSTGTVPSSAQGVCPDLRAWPNAL